MKTYKVQVMIPGVYFIEADDDEDVLKRIGEVYKRFYIQNFRDLVEPLPEPEDVK